MYHPYRRAIQALLTSLLIAPSFAQSFISLPDAPSPQQASAVSGSVQIRGQVVDPNGAPIPTAHITLASRGRIDERTATAGPDGSFSFANLPVEVYRLTIAAPGFEPLITPEFSTRPGDTQAPAITLKVSATASSVDVTANPQQVALAEVQEQEHQRIFGVFQNFYTSYIWKAEPMPQAMKYKLAARTLLDPTSFVVTAGLAGAEQYEGTYPGYGPGISGYGKRFGAALADSTSTRLIGSAILPSILHQDPRYFYQGSGSITSRTFHAVSSALVTRSDKGNNQPNYSHLGGSLASAGISNLYKPDASRGVGLTFQTFGVNIAGTMVGNIFREFLLRHLEPSVPVFANGRAVK